MRNKKKVISNPNILFNKNFLSFSGRTVEIWSAQSGRTIDVKQFLLHHGDFHGNTNVHHVVRYRDLFRPLAGKYKGRFGSWNPEKLPEKGIVVLEHHFHEAKKLASDLNDLAQRVIVDKNLYDNEVFWKDYLALAQEGYNLLASHENEFAQYGVPQMRNTKLFPAPLSIERAGLVTSRLAIGVDRNALIDGEIRVVTKRAHFKDEDDSRNITVTVKFRNVKHTLQALNGKPITVCDFVNPASGASLDAIILVAELLGARPSKIHHRSFSITEQGTLFTQKALLEKNIHSTYYSVAECDEMTEALYLAGKRAVADAGDVLCHVLPNGYED